MRLTLQDARKKAKLRQKETANAIGISERYYQHIESGSREGKGHIWDSLETLFGVPQMLLRKQSQTSPSAATEGKAY